MGKYQYKLQLPLWAESESHGLKMATCIASSVITDQDILEEIRQDECEFYGVDSYEEETPTTDSEDESLSYSEDEASTNKEITTMSTPSGSSAGPSTTLSDDEINISKEFEQGCGCEEVCYGKFSVSEVKEFRLSMSELTKNERDMFMMGKLQLLVRDPGIVTHARSSKAVKKQRLTAAYAFDHRRVCQKAFCFLHNLGEFTLRALRKHVIEAGPIPREHGSKGRKAYNAYPFEVVSSAIAFIKNYASVFGLPQPAAPRGRANQAPTYLPAHQNYKIVHLKYQEACTKENKPFMHYRSFIDSWHQCVPHIIFMTPRTDVCQRCENFRISIQRAVSEECKKTLLAEFSMHLEVAQKERDTYLLAIKKSKEAAASASEKNSIPTFTHITFDFAQQVFLPYHARQVGPLYYKVPMRVQIFGICDSQPHQINYLFNEKETIGSNGSKSHGPNSVISMIHHYLEVHGKKELNYHFHADNCVGQNKNKTVLAYFMWRTIVGLNEEITLSFMRVGHTRCIVDACFGLLKKRYRSSDCDTMEHLKTTVELSSRSNVAQLYSWEWREWDKFFITSFKPYPGIRKIQHFRFTKTSPGIVFVRTTCDEPETQFKLLKRDIRTSRFKADRLPPVLTPPGLTTARAQYLYDEVREFALPEFRDTLCPTPNASLQN